MKTSTRLAAVQEAIETEGRWPRNWPRGTSGLAQCPSLHLRDARDLESAEDIAQALFEHMRFAFNGGAIRPTITVFDEGGADGTAHLEPTANRRLSAEQGQQIGDPAQNDLTAAIMELGWEPSGKRFEILPLVIQGSDSRPHLFELPEDVRQEVPLIHPGYPTFNALKHGTPTMFPTCDWTRAA